MAGLHGALFPAKESLKEPLVTKQDKDGIEVEERKGVHYCQNNDETNSTNFGVKNTIKSQPGENISSITDSIQTTGELKP